MVNNVCKVCGLPKEICTCGDLLLTTQVITITTEKRKWGKVWTLVKGLNPAEMDVKSLAKQLKRKLACGGTFKNGVIELQGSQVNKVKEFLLSQGFQSENIEVKGR